jgi:NitT/TauT family transport system substrate-binding protein
MNDYADVDSCVDERRLASPAAVRDSRRRVSRGRRTAIAALGAAVALIAASAAAGQTRATAGSLETVTVVAPPFEPAALAFYADARGFFRKQGIDVVVKVVDQPTIAPAIASGSATFGPSDIGGFLNGKARGAPLKLVAGGGFYTPQAPTAALVAAPGKRFASARDLVGKRIGVDRVGSIAQVALLKWLKRGGVRAEDVQLSYYLFPDMIGLLAQGTIDAAVLPEPWLTQAKLRGATLAARIFQSVCSNDCLWTVWYARSDVDPTLAARFRNAIQEAAVWANRKENAAAINAILARQTQLEPTVLRTMTHSRFATRLRLLRAQAWIDVYKEFELIPQTFTAADLVK